MQGEGAVSRTREAGASEASGGCGHTDLLHENAWEIFGDARRCSSYTTSLPQVVPADHMPPGVFLARHLSSSRWPFGRYTLPKTIAAAKTKSPLPTTWTIERPQLVPKKRWRIVAISTSSKATTT